MTDTDTTAPAASLEPYMGKPVSRATIEIRGTGSGLEKGMAMPPITVQPGQEVDVVLRCVADKHRHEYDEDGDSFVLVNMLRAETATLVEDGEITVARALETAEERVAERRAKEEEAKRRENGEVTLFEGDTSEERVGLAKPNLDAAEQAIRDRAGQPKQVDCPRCSGEGQINDGGSWDDCPRCEGEGVVADDTAGTELGDVIALEDAAPEEGE